MDLSPGSDTVPCTECAGEMTWFIGFFSVAGSGNSTPHPPPGFAVGVIVRDRGGSGEAKAAIERNGRAIGSANDQAAHRHTAAPQTRYRSLKQRGGDAVVAIPGMNGDGVEIRTPTVDAGDGITGNCRPVGSNEE